MGHILYPLLCCLWAGIALGQNATCSPEDRADTSIYDFDMKTLDNSTLSLEEYRNKVLLIVNVATFCDYTYQYKELNALRLEFADKDFNILGIPCNQFGLQEPGSGWEILNGLKYVRPGYGFVPAFTLTSKTDVNGQHEDGLYTYIKCVCPGPSNTIHEISDPIHSLFWSPIRRTDIAWNFEKILIGRDGKPRRRFHHTVEPKDISAYIRDLIEEQAT